VATVRKRKRGTRAHWFARYKGADGLWHEAVIPEGVKGTTAAKEWAAALELREKQVALGLQVAPSNEPLESAAKRYLEAIRHHRSFVSIEGRWRLHLLPTLGNVPVSQLRPTQVEELLAKLRDEGYSQQSQRHVCTTLSACYEWLIKDGVVSVNPVSRVDVPPVPRKKPMALSPEQVRAIARAASFRGLRDYVLLSFYTAWRPGEGLQLKKADVELAAGIIRLDRKKVGKEGVAFLPPPAVDLAARILREVPGEHLFLNAAGEPLKHRQLARAFKTAVKRAGLVERYEAVCRRKGCGLVDTRRPSPGEKCGRCGFTLMERAVPLEGVSLKTLRTSALTLLASRGGREGTYAAQFQAGHASRSTTERHYVAEVPPAIRAAVTAAYEGTVPLEESGPLLH
jgi:integrase